MHDHAANNEQVNDFQNLTQIENWQNKIFNSVMEWAANSFVGLGFNVTFGGSEAIMGI